MIGPTLDVKIHLLPGLGLNWYVEVCVFIIYGGNSLPYIEVLIVSGVSILNDSVFSNVFKLLKSKIGLHRLLGLGTKNSLL